MEQPEILNMPDITEGRKAVYVDQTRSTAKPFMCLLKWTCHFTSLNEYTSDIYSRDLHPFSARATLYIFHIFTGQKMFYPCSLTSESLLWKSLL